LKKRYRLTTQRDIQRVLATPRLYAGRTLVAFAIAAAGEPAGDRVGVAVSRRLKRSVDRNRARRRLREAVRAQLSGADSEAPHPGIRYDVVLIGRPGAISLPWAVLSAEVAAAWRRLAAR